MTTIQRRVTDTGEPRYRILVRLRGHPNRSATFRRKTDAKRWAAQTETAIRDNQHFKTPEANRRTLAEMIDR